MWKYNTVIIKLLLQVCHTESRILLIHKIL